jgi:hypothetical protein
MRNAVTPRGNIIILLTALLFCGAGYLQIMHGFYWDKDWMLMAARMVLAGRQLGRDIFEVNPPLIFWLYTIPVSLSQHLLMVKDFQALAIMALGMVALSIGLSMHMITAHPMFAGNGKKQMQFVLLLCVVFIAFPSPNFFADREHLILVLTFPYVMSRMPSVYPAPLSLRMRITIGCLAALGFCLKPHTVLIFAGLQLLVYLRERSLRFFFCIENTIIFTGFAFYMIAIWCFASDYFTQVIPALMVSYSSYNDGWRQRIYYIEKILLPLFFMMIGLRWRGDSPYRKDIGYFLWLAALWFMYTWINNGWEYTYYPLAAMLLFTTAFVLWESLYWVKQFRERGSPAWRPMLCAVGCMIAFCLQASITIISFPSARYDANYVPEADAALVKSIAERHPHSFGALTMDFTFFPAIYRGTGAELVTRFPHLWMLPDFYMTSPEFIRKHQKILDYVAYGYTQDLTHNKPDLVIVESSPVIYGIKGHMDLLAMFSGYPDFQSAWQPYHYTQTVDQCGKYHRKTFCRFDLYERKE